MSAGINKVLLLGNLGKDPEIKKLENGVTVCNFQLATSDSFKNSSGEKTEQTEWHNIIMWRNVAESIQKAEVKKGDRIFVEGKIRSRKWTDKDGAQKSSVEIVCDTFTVIARKKIVTTIGTLNTSTENQ